MILMEEVRIMSGLILTAICHNMPESLRQCKFIIVFNEDPSL